MKEHHSQKDNNSASRASANDHSDRNGASMPAVPALTNNAPVQLAKTKNDTGLPDDLKEGIENLSGMAMDDTKVHYNSSRPAAVNALAFAQGNQIHVAPGQEKHLPHEAWHVVQQKAGRVQPTSQLNGIPVNTDVGLEQEADRLGAAALQKKERPSEPLSDITVQGDGTIQGFFTLIPAIGILGREIGKEVARETGLRIVKGKLAEQLAGLENEVLAKVLDAMKKNPELIKALQNAQIAAHLKAGAQKLAAPIAEKIRTSITDTLSAVADMFPNLRDEIQQYLSSLEQKINENKVVVAIKNTIEVITTTVAQVGAHMALTKGIDFINKEALNKAVSVGTQVVKENIDDASRVASEVLEQAAELEKYVDAVDDLLLPLKVIRKPIRTGVKEAMDAAEDMMGSATEASGKLKDVTDIKGMQQVLAETSDDVAEKATGAIKDSATGSNAAKVVKYGAYTIQAAFVLSEIAKAKTYTESTIAMLKPVVALTGAIVSGPMAPLVSVAAPVLLEQVLKKLETTVEPKLIQANAMIQSIPLLGSVASGTYQSAAFVGRGINSIPSLISSTASGIYYGAKGLIFPQSSPGTSGQPKEEKPSTEEATKTTTTETIPDINIPLDIEQTTLDAFQSHLNISAETPSRMEDVD